MLQHQFHQGNPGDVADGRKLGYSNLRPHVTHLLVTSAEREVKVSRRSGMYQSQAVLVMRAIFKICGNESQLGLLVQLGRWFVLNVIT